MTDEERDALMAEILADLEDLTAREEAVTAKARRLSAALAERNHDAVTVHEATVHELHPR